MSHGEIGSLSERKMKPVSKSCLFVFDFLPLGNNANGTSEDSAAAPSGASGAKTRPLLGVWHGSGHTSHVPLHIGRSLAGLHLVRDWIRREK